MKDKISFHKLSRILTSTAALTSIFIGPINLARAQVDATTEQDRLIRRTWFERLHPESGPFLNQFTDRLLSQGLHTALIYPDGCTILEAHTQFIWNIRTGAGYDTLSDGKQIIFFSKDSRKLAFSQPSVIPPPASPLPTKSASGERVIQPMQTEKELLAEHPNASTLRLHELVFVPEHEHVRDRCERWIGTGNLLGFGQPTLETPAP